SCFIATASGELRGFACYESTRRNFFGPMGVAAPARGEGIGSALLLGCLHAMAGLGYAYAIIGGVGPAEFYPRVVGATEIEGSTPGIYRDRLKKCPATAQPEPARRRAEGGRENRDAVVVRPERFRPKSLPASTRRR